MSEQPTTRYCSGCNGLRDEATGGWIITKRKRWACAACLQKANQSWYAKPKNDAHLCDND
jgi:hypothetical protein